MSFGRFIALLSFILPIGTIAATYFLAVGQGTAPLCNPFLVGCTDITHTGMKGDAGFLFRGGMIAACSFLMLWWWLMHTWLQQHANRYALAAMSLLGTLGALGLIVGTAVLLPEKSQSPFWLHVKGANLFFQGTILAMLINYFLIVFARKKGLLVPSFRMKTGIMLALVIIAISVEGVAITLGMSNKSRIIEWWGTLLVGLYFLSSYWDWAKLKLVSAA